MKRMLIVFLCLVTGVWHVPLCASEKKRDGRQTVVAPHSILKVKSGGVEKPHRTGSRVSLVLENNTEHGVLKHCPPRQEEERVQKLEAAREVLRNGQAALAALQADAAHLGVDAPRDRAPFPVQDPRLVRVSVRSEKAAGTALVEASKREGIRKARGELVKDTLRQAAAQVKALEGNLVERNAAIRFKDKAAYLACQGKGKGRVERSDAVRAESVEQFLGE